MNPEAVAELYDRLNAVCFGGRLRPVVIRMVPWILSRTDGRRLAGAWDAEAWAIGLDRALLDHPQYLFGVVLHEMTHQACYQADGSDGHGSAFCATGAAAVARLDFDVPAPTLTTAATWPYPTPSHLLKEI